MLTQAALDAIAVTDLKSLAPLFKVLDQKCYDARLANNGLVPKEIFPYTTGIAGTCICYQVIVEVWNGHRFIGYALRKRDQDESGDAWKDMYHNVCTVARMTETPIKILQRIFSDITGKVPPDSRMKYVGKSIHPEIERHCDAHTHVWRIKINPDELETLKGQWKIFGPEQLGDPTIIDHMKAIIEWSANPDRKPFERLVFEHDNKPS